MKNLMKLVFGLFFFLGFLFSANAQTDSAANVPSPDDIVCVQVAENVFECAVNDPNFSGEEEQMEDYGTTEPEMTDPSMEEYELYEETEPSENLEQEIFNEGATEEEKRTECERILDEHYYDQSKEDKQLYEEDGSEDELMNQESNPAGDDMNEPSADEEYEPFRIP